MGGGGSKWTEEYIKGLPEVGDPDLLYDRTDRSPVRIGRKVYEYATNDGTWEPVFTIPDDYETSGTVPGTESPDGAIPTLSRTSGTSGYASNPYFPQLVPEYTPQGLLDWSEYMPEGGMFGHEQYQPWTNPNSIPENIFNYQPPTIHASAGGGGSGGGSGYTGGYTPSGHIEVAGSPSTTGIGIIDDYVPTAGDGPDRGTGGADVDTMSPHLIPDTHPLTPENIVAIQSTPGSGYISPTVKANMGAATQAAIKAADERRRANEFASAQAEIDRQNIAKAITTKASVDYSEYAEEQARADRLAKAIAEIGPLPNYSEYAQEQHNKAIAAAIAAGKSKTKADRAKEAGYGDASAGKGSFGGMDAGLAGPR